MKKPEHDDTAWSLTNEEQEQLDNQEDLDLEFNRAQKFMLVLCAAVSAWAIFELIWGKAV